MWSKDLLGGRRRSLGFQLPTRAPEGVVGPSVCLLGWGWREADGSLWMPRSPSRSPRLISPCGAAAGDDGEPSPGTCHGGCGGRGPVRVAAGGWWRLAPAPVLVPSPSLSLLISCGGRATRVGVASLSAESCWEGRHPGPRPCTARTRPTIHQPAPAEKWNRQTCRHR